MYVRFVRPTLTFSGNSSSKSSSFALHRQDPGGAPVPYRHNDNSERTNFLVPVMYIFSRRNLQPQRWSTLGTLMNGHPRDRPTSVPGRPREGFDHMHRKPWALHTGTGSRQVHREPHRVVGTCLRAWVRIAHNRCSNGTSVRSGLYIGWSRNRPCCPGTECPR